MEEMPQGSNFRTRSAWGLRVIVGIGIVAVLAYLAFRPAGESSEAKLPAFDRLDYVAKEGSLSAADLRGHPLVLNFWASWCDPCRREMPLLDLMAHRYADAGVLIVGIDVQDRLEAALDFLQEIDVDYPIVEDLDQRLFVPLRDGAGFSTSLPQTYFVTPAGDIVREGVAQPRLGELEEDELEAAIQYLLDNPG